MQYTHVLINHNDTRSSYGHNGERIMTRDRHQWNHLIHRQIMEDSLVTTEPSLINFSCLYAHLTLIIIITLPSYFNIIMQNKILSIESLFQPFMLLFKYNSDIQIMIMIVQIIVPTAYVHSHLLFSIFSSLASFNSNTCG
jgi:hypothetical protein